MDIPTSISQPKRVAYAIRPKNLSLNHVIMIKIPIISMIEIQTLTLLFSYIILLLLFLASWGSPTSFYWQVYYSLHINQRLLEVLRQLIRRANNVLKLDTTWFSVLAIYGLSFFSYVGFYTLHFMFSMFVMNCFINVKLCKYG